MAGVRRFLYRSYAFWQRILAPGPESTQEFYREVLEGLVRSGVRWLDLGCGHNVFGNWFSAAEERKIVVRAGAVVGIDMDAANLQRHETIRRRVVGDLRRLPFRAGRFDLVTANMVMEHVDLPVTVLREVRRVLKPGGRFVFHTPNFLNPPVRIASITPEGIKRRVIWLLERREERDVFPTHYRFNTPSRIRAQAGEAGFRVQEMLLRDGPAITAFLGPLAIPELVFMRLRRTRALEFCRSNIIGVLEKPSDDAVAVTKDELVTTQAVIGGQAR